MKDNLDESVDKLLEPLSCGKSQNDRQLELFDTIIAAAFVAVILFGTFLMAWLKLR